MSTHTLTGLFSDHATAERAAERLRAIGIPEGSLEIHEAIAGDVSPGNAPGSGLFGVADPLLPGPETAGPEVSGTVVVALRVPDELNSEAVSIMREDALEVETERDAA